MALARWTSSLVDAEFGAESPVVADHLRIRGLRPPVGPVASSRCDDLAGPPLPQRRPVAGLVDQAGDPPRWRRGRPRPQHYRPCARAGRGERAEDRNRRRGGASSLPTFAARHGTSPFTSRNRAGYNRPTPRIGRNDDAHVPHACLCHRTAFRADRGAGHRHVGLHLVPARRRDYHSGKYRGQPLRGGEAGNPPSARLRARFLAGRDPLCDDDTQYQRSQ